MKKREAELKAEVARMLAAAEAADAEEDETFGKDKRGDEMPDWAGDKQKRLAKIQQAMAALEAEAKLAAQEERRIETEKEQQRQAEGRKKPGKPAAPPSEEPDPKSQRNFTDPESRIMKSKDGFVQAYNAQAAVDAGAQIIVAHELTQCGNDQGQLVPLIEATWNNLGRKPEQASADSGYCSESNLEALEAYGVDGYVAPGRAKHPTAANRKIGGPLTQRMRKKIECFWRWPSGVSAWPTIWPGCSRIGATRRGSCTALSICSALACSRSAAATRTPTTLIICAPIQRSSSPAVACRIRAGICVPNRRCRGWRIRRNCAT